MEVRLDPITHQPIILAPKRAQRPHFGKSPTPHPALDKHRLDPINKKRDPFAVGQEHQTDPEVYVDTDQADHVPDTPGWNVRVIPNHYPITNHHEVIILSPNPTRDIARMSLKQVERIINTFVNRSKNLSASGQVFIFANHGPSAGASVSHPHAQLAVFPTLPPLIKNEVEAVGEHYKKTGNCQYCQLIQHEQKINRRIVWQNDEFIILCPEASGWPYALTLLPKTHQAALTALKANQVTPMAQALQTMLKLYYSSLQNPPYNFWFHSVRGHFFHWHLHLIPRTKTLAGIELGAGLMVNDRISPEDAAAQFRKALKERN